VENLVDTVQQSRDLRIKIAVSVGEDAKLHRSQESGARRQELEDKSESKIEIRQFAYKFRISIFDHFGLLTPVFRLPTSDS
jgi:hypothetical protein